MSLFLFEKKHNRYAEKTVLWKSVPKGSKNKTECLALNFNGNDVPCVNNILQPITIVM